MINCLLTAILISAPHQAKSLVAQPPIVVPGGPGSFDFMNVDSKDRLAFACHPGKSALAVINLDADTVQSVDLGVACNGVSADSANKKVYAAGPGKTLVQLDMATWTKTASLALDGPGDSVIYDSKTKTVYVDNDDGTNLWFVDPDTMKITSAVTIKEAPEVMALDNNRGKIFQNIKSTNSLQVIDIASKSVFAEYALGDLTSPHGLAEDKKAGKLFSVGKNGKLVILDADSGKILSTVDVVKSSDQIAYDTKLKRLYIPGGGELQVVQITDSGANVIDSVPAPKGCHSITVDPKTHNVWVAYSDQTNSYVMKYVASQPATTQD
jgi:DNA-binding beta-propeller fold protein YncE